MREKGEAWELRYEEVMELTSASTASAVPKLLTMKNDSHRSVRCAVASALGNFPSSKEAFEALIELLTDPEVWVRIRTVQALRAFEGSKAPDFLVRQLSTEEDEKVRATIVKTIGTFGDARFISNLLPYLKDEDPRVRANTIEGLGFIDSDELKETLRPFLCDPNSRIRANAARIMSTFADTVGESRSTFEKMLQSGDQYERASAAYALGELGHEVYVTSLLNLLGDRSFVVRRNIVDALSKFGSLIEHRIAHRLKSDDPTIRACCCEVLGRIGTQACLRSLIPHLDDSDGLVRSSCEKAFDIIKERQKGLSEEEAS